MHLLFLSSLGHHLFTNYMRSTDQLSFKVFGIPVKNVINYLFKMKKLSVDVNTFKLP